MDISELADLPTPFYRVAVKVLIMDDQQRLLVCKNDKGEYEMPGGGWEHDEPLELCVQRELAEELHATVTSISATEFVLRGRSSRGWRTMRIVVRATIEPGELQPDDGLVEYGYYTRQEFEQFNFDSHDEEFGTAADKIWHD